MNIRLSSAYTAPNNNFNTKPQVAFGDNAQCLKALQEVQRRVSPEAIGKFQFYAQTLDDKPKFIEQVTEYLKGKDIKPVVKKLVNLVIFDKKS